MKHPLLFVLTFLIVLLPRLQAVQRPNIVFILLDDMGWSDIGCYGGEIQTPNIDSLAKNGLRFTRFYNTAKCNTSRACLLTGVYAQQCGMMGADKLTNAVTLGEVLRAAGYRTFASGKHHGTENLTDRGFDHYYGLRDGCCNFWNPGEKRPGEPEPGQKGVRFWCDDEKTYYPYTPEDKRFYATDAFTNKALQWLDEKELNEKPFFLYLPYTAPHYPLHAWPEDVAKYQGRYDAGYDAIRKERYQRMVEMGIIDPAKNPLTEWQGKDWKTLSDEDRSKEIRRMEIYAAMIDRVDQNIGRILNKIKAQGKLENTLVLFASDNGGCPEEAPTETRSTRLEDFGGVASYEAVGRDWATVQNTPLRKWKSDSYEGGIRTPLVISWLGKLQNPGGFYHQPGHLIDIMPTLVALAGAIYPDETNKLPIVPMQGVSLLPAFENKPLIRKEPIFWQYSSGGAIRVDNLKAVFSSDKSGKKWELFDFSQDENEMNDLSGQKPKVLDELKNQWQAWYDKVSPSKRIKK